MTETKKSIIQILCLLAMEGLLYIDQYIREIYENHKIMQYLPREHFLQPLQVKVTHWGGSTGADTEF